MSKLKTWRIERNLSQHELAAATGLPRWKIQLIEGGVQHPSPQEADALAAGLGVKVNDLFPALGARLGTK